MNSPALAAQLEARTRELVQAADQLAATSDVLRAISNSRSDPGPVLKAVAEHAARLCDADISQIFQIDGELLRVVASHGPIPSRLRGEALRITRGSVTGRAVIDRRTIHVHDLSAELDTEFPDAKPHAGLWGHRTTVATPLLREGAPIGAIFIRRTEVRPFTDRQIALLETFAHQAGIAIEQVRLVRELEVRNQEVTEALEQQTATSDVLRVISSSPTDIQPVLDVVAESAARLCDASDVVIRQLDGDVLRLVAHIGPVPVLPGADPTISRTTFAGRAILERRTIHIHDVLEPRVREDYPDARFLQQPGHFRTTLCAPLLREDTAIGAIIIRRPEMRPFSDKQIKLLETFAAQAVIAIENTRLFNETKEALEQQTATAEILRVISSSPTDIQPVLDAVAESAARLCDAVDVVIRRVDGDVTRVVAHIGSVPVRPDGSVRPLTARSISTCAIRERRTIHVHDVRDPQVREEYPDSHFAHRTMLVVPLLREDTAIGVITMRRPEVRPFSDKQIKLLETFASQAVIAIENVRLFNETKEALEQQTATAEILRVISSSPTDIQPVLDAVAESAARLCGASDAIIRRVDGDLVRLVAHHGAVPINPNRNVRPLAQRSITNNAIRERRTIHVHDTTELHVLEEYPDTVRLGRAWSGTLLVAPLVREDTAIGAIVIRRPEVQPFSDKQVKLLEIFAAQAVIAIENVRLFNETKEALEQQTATAEILKVISSSPTDTQPVFDAIVKSGVHLFGGLNMTLRLVKGDRNETVASSLVGWDEKDIFSTPLNDDRFVSPRAILRRDIVHVPDIRAEEWLHERMRERFEKLGCRAVLCAPMLREDKAIGTITVVRATPGLFNDKHVALLRTFSDQAVIAIENVRLFKELEARNKDLGETLEQQTATAEILKVISRSPTDIQPVFDAILENATRLCGAHMGILGLYDGETYRRVAQRGASAEFVRWLAEEGPKYPPDAHGLVGQMISERRTIHVLDRREQRAYRERNPSTVALVELGGARSSLVVPMLKEGRVVGGIVIYRPEVRPFTQKQIDLVSTFASQAVIAIENVRLFNETKEALERQTATAEILKVISSSPTDVQPVLDTVAERSGLLCRAEGSRVWLAHGGQLHAMASYGTLYGSDSQGEVLPLRTTSPVGRAFLERRCVHVEDIVPLIDTEYPDVRELQARIGFRTVLTVPMLREGESVGVIALLRNQRPFAPAEISLVQTFADQAVIAIENVRLFNEIQDKSRQLEVASRHKSQFLANMSHELRTPLNAILGYTELILDGIYGDVSTKVRDVMGRVDKSGRHLLGLINDVLDLSKIEAGQLTLSLADYSLTDVVQTVFTALESLAAEKKLALKVALASDLPRGRGDDRRLTQVLLNLVGNAIKFTEAGEVQLEARCSDDAFVVAVADTGPGISEADQQRIFEEFQQVDDSATRKKGGTGLGLSIARRIIELHGGRIQVESAPGRGATFTVTLPVRVERQAGPS